MQRKSGAHELLDGPLDPRTLAANLRDLTRVNRWLGGVELSWRALEPLLRAHEPDRPLRFLDVGTGAADIPICLSQRAQSAGVGLEILATDVRPEIVEAAAARSSQAGQSSVAVRLGSAERIDEPDRSFDVVHASLVLHHLEPTGAIALLREMARVSSGAVIVNDLDRRRIWWIGAWLLAHAATANRYTRHDAPLSVRRAYRPDELREFAAEAGLTQVSRTRDHLGYRYALVFARGGEW